MFHISPLAHYPRVVGSPKGQSCLVRHTHCDILPDMIVRGGEGRGDGMREGVK